VILGAVSEAVAAGARLAAACGVIGISHRTVERWRARPGSDDRRAGPHRRPSNALTPAEETRLLALLTSERYAGLSPKQLVPQLADEGLYLASESTIYRLQRRYGLRRVERRIERTHVARSTTVHRATGPNQVWSWDITWLPTVVRGRFVYLYLVMDVWSRRIVGWTVAERESAETAAELIQHICRDGDVEPRGLVLHSDNGKPMRGATMVSTLQWLGIVPSFSRPHVSDDNPYSEALFRTLKYTPEYPQLPFVNVEAAERWVGRFVAWYNREHRHSAIRYITPDERHFGRETSVLHARDVLYRQARATTPDRWSGDTRNWSSVALVELNPDPSQRSAA
jgi:putative transposase